MKFFLISTLCLFLCSIVFTTADEVSYTGTWACSQYFNGEMPDISLEGNSLRQIVRISIPGEQLRFHFSNIYGNEDLELLSVHVAKSAGQGTGSIVPETDTAITFNQGQPNVIIPANGDIISDTISFSASTLEELAITIYYGKIPQDLTGHAGARTNSFIELGNAVSKETFSDENKFVRWYTLSAIDVVNTGNTEAIICYGDSITDGRGSTTDKQNRWPDVFAEKLQSNPATQHLAVLNHGIGGSSLYGENSAKWPTGTGRFQKDVVEQVNVKYMIVLYGINDIVYGGHDADYLIEGFKKLIKDTHDLGITVYGSPILPFKTQELWTPELNEIKETVNDWIKNTPASEGGFDAIIDFASVVADPNDSMVFYADLCDNDGLHPNYLGHQAMGSSVDLNLFISENGTDIENGEESIDDTEELTSIAELEDEIDSEKELEELKDESDSEELEE